MPALLNKLNSFYQVLFFYSLIKEGIKNGF